MHDTVMMLSIIAINSARTARLLDAALFVQHKEEI